MELELKHIAPYLPYGLRIGAVKDYEGIRTMVCTENNSEEVNIEAVARLGYKPILRPLSDLTKAINHNGESFVPKDRLREISGALTPDDDFKNTFSIHYNDAGDIRLFTALCVHVDQMTMFNKLFEWHFDVFNLIDAGLAIDINTLNNLKNTNKGGGK